MTKVKHSTPVLDRQNTLPRKAAATLDYAAGFALGASALREDGDWLRPLLLDARVLTARHGSCAVAGLLMHVAEPGLRGLLEGAGYFLERQGACGRPGEQARAAEAVAAGI